MSRPLTWLYRSLLLSCSFSSSLGFATSSDTINRYNLQPVIVHASSGEVVADDDQLQRGLQRFQRKHALAPQATLRFQLTQTGAASPSPLQLLLRNAASERRLQLSSDGWLLPATLEPVLRHAQLLANRDAGAVAIYPIVRRPDEPSDSATLGELRLECEVAWAISEASLPLIFRGGFALAGGPCHSSHIQMDLHAPMAIQAVRLSQGEHRQQFKVGRDQHSYDLPLYDAHWSDQTLVHFEPAQASLPAPPTSAGARRG